VIAEMAAVSSFFRGLGKVVKWLLIVGVLILVIVILVALAGLGNAADESEKSSEQVTPARYAQIQDGDSQSDVRKVLGDAEDTDTSKVQGLGKSVCWYYGVLAQRTTQICFQSGKVDYKAQYGS